MSNNIPQSKQAPSRLDGDDSQLSQQPKTKKNFFTSINRRAWMITLMSLGGWTLVNMDGSLFNFNYPLVQKSLGISDNSIGNLYAIIYAVGALSTWVSGPLMDRYGRKPAFQLCMLFAAVGSVLTAGAGGFFILVMARSITQAGATTEWMAGQVLVAEEAPSHARGRLIGISQIG